MVVGPHEPDIDTPNRSPISPTSARNAAPKAGAAATAATSSPNVHHDQPRPTTNSSASVSMVASAIPPGDDGTVSSGSSASGAGPGTLEVTPGLHLWSVGSISAPGTLFRPRTTKIAWGPGGIAKKSVRDSASYSALPRTVGRPARRSPTSPT